ncbi:MAG: clan AA aspartic protease [Proteobacteria bacterium]|nr:MAG: clan AA aspartic protease [Pseudomonadota bacterium]
MKKQIIGRREFISLLDLDLKDIKCKIDTGAYTGALHCEDIYILDTHEVEFSSFGKRFKLPIHKQKLVKSSNGKREFRYYIKTNALFLGKKYKIILSLTDRSSMKNPILIGRKFLKDRFLVDVSKEFTQKDKSL